MTTLTTFARIDNAARKHGWTVQDQAFARTGKVWFLRDNQQVKVKFSSSGGVVSVEYGLFGQFSITGTGKAVQLIELLSARCATVGCKRLPTVEITYDYRDEGEPTTDQVCGPCADSYERRPVLKNFTRRNLQEG